MTLDPIRFGTLPVSPWRNGAGRKADIASEADWHVGFAWLDADAPFSDFTGQDRTITLVEGVGFALDFVDHPTLRIAERYQPTSFDGGWHTQCRLLGRPCVVLNAMTPRGRYRHSVATAEADATPDIVPGDVETVFLVVLTGSVTVSNLSDRAELGPKDAIRLHGPVSLHAAAGSRLCTITIEAVPQG